RALASDLGDSGRARGRPAGHGNGGGSGLGRAVHAGPSAAGTGGRCFPRSAGGVGALRLRGGAARRAGCAHGALVLATPARRRPGYLHVAEREIAILFGDLRSFTQLSEKKLPYDLVFLLNRYFAETGQAVEAAGGHIDKFIGDGVMALFGLDSGVEAGCRQA